MRQALTLALCLGTHPRPKPSLNLVVKVMPLLARTRESGSVTSHVCDGCGTEGAGEGAGFLEEGGDEEEDEEGKQVRCGLGFLGLGS